MSTERNKEQAGALKQYEYTDAVETAKAYFKGDDLAATVWVSKYALKDSMGKIYENSPEQMHRRIALGKSSASRNAIRIRCPKARYTTC